MGIQLSFPQKSLIGLMCLLLIYIIAIIVYYVEISKSSSSPTPSPTPPAFTPTPSISTSTSSHTPTSTPISSSTPTPTPTTPHLSFNNNEVQGPPHAPSDFYRLGCQAAFSEGLFPFTSFNTQGTFNTGILQNYYTYDKWGFGGTTGEFDCGWTLLGGKTPCPASAATSPNQPWNDEACDICATAAKDPNCMWSNSNSCTLLFGETLSKTYHGMDISQCYYNGQGYFSSNQLCCNPSVA
jgi:hypothetical protein